MVNVSATAPASSYCKDLVGEAIRIFSKLPYAEKQLLLRSFSRMTESSLATSHQSEVEVLTRRELQVLVLLARGYTRREIGASLEISANTSAKHIANIYRKLDISTTAEAVKAALDAGLIH